MARIPNKNHVNNTVMILKVLEYSVLIDSKVKFNISFMIVATDFSKKKTTYAGLQWQILQKKRYFVTKFPLKTIYIVDLMLSISRKT